MMWDALGDKCRHKAGHRVPYNGDSPPLRFCQYSGKSRPRLLPAYTMWIGAPVYVDDTKCVFVWDVAWVDLRSLPCQQELPQLR